MQNFFLDKSSHAYVPSAPSILGNVKKIITAFRKREFPIIFTRFSLNEEDRGMMVKWWNDRVMEGSRDSMLIEEFNLENAIVLRKKSYSAFHETPLLSILRERKIDSIVITGLMTHLCCDTTARHAFMHDFKVYFVIDATATYTEELHLSSLRALVHGFAIPIRTGDLVEGML
jgi:isochorismate hydrolase